MSTISSKHTKRQGSVEPNVILGLLVLILALVVFTPFTGNLYNSLSTAPSIVDNTHAGLSANVSHSFSSDQQYWEHNCNHGWSSGFVALDVGLNR